MTSERAQGSFIENGSIFLEKLIGSWNGRCSPIRSFSAKELKQATDNYNSVNIFGGDASYSWYKGSIDGRIVSIKKWKDFLYINNFERNLAINDIVKAAQMNAHNNILKLIGCCLETHIPIPVYECADYVTLYSRMHITGERETLPSQRLLWKSRFRIATDTASAVAYLHIAFCRPIIHRNIKSLNIFLDRHNFAKLSGFELSIGLPEGKTHVKDAVIGTFGYLAPEYLKTSLVSEKVDVYSFGVLLMELLTGQKPVVDGFDLIAHFRTHVLSNENHQVLDSTILEEIGQIDVQLQVQALSQLALQCTETDAEERPTMLDVARQLLQLKRTMVDH